MFIFVDFRRMFRHICENFMIKLLIHGGVGGLQNVVLMVVPTLPIECFQIGFCAIKQTFASRQLQNFTIMIH